MSDILLRFLPAIHRTQKETHRLVAAVRGDDVESAVPIGIPDRAGVWQTERKLKRLTATVLGEGPLFAKVRLRYEFEGTAGLYDNVPAFAEVDVTVFTREGCPFCVRAKGMLHDAGIDFEELVLNRDFSEATIRAVSGAATVPQVFINGEHIGGSEALKAYLSSSKAA